ncbi:hypothetical protein HKX48_004075 [Thoreauomyces humboldtii]|nr:hypothetical protein HKX48_004075 [Thoreauomyces humboldtii]
MTPVGNSLVTSLYIDFGIQMLAFAISAPLRTERFYDLSGALTFITCTLVALLWRRDGEVVSGLAARQIILACLVMVWSSRLGFFLARRVSKTEDKRFEKYKQNPITFFPVWVMQAIWVFMTCWPAWIVIGNPSSSQPSIYISDGFGIAIWVYGFALEVTADAQKSAYKNEHPSDFVRTGVWRWSRYANYNGEISLWIGAFILAARGFVDKWQWVSIVSPLFVACLIVFVSGIKLSEKGQEERYGTRPDFRQYKAQTSKFFLWPPRKPTVETSNLNL